MATGKHNDQNKIYLDRWMAFHPYKKPGPGDYYYLELSNRLYKMIESWPEQGLLSELQKDDIEDLCCYLSCYLEDVVSGIGLMRAFTEQHRELYAKDLPFYNPAEYYNDDINREDIYFLLWHYFSKILYEDTIVSPLSTDLIYLGNAVYQVLDEEFEKAPENTGLKELMTLSPAEEDFFVIRERIEFIVLDSYLFFHNRLECMVEVAEKLEAIKDTKEDHDLERDIPLITYETIDNYLLSKVHPLLATHGKDWLAQVLGRDHPLFQDIGSITEKKHGVYMYRERKDNDLWFEHIASGSLIPVTVRSYTTLPDLKEGKTIMSCSFIRWKNKWWFSGISAVFPFDPGRIEKERGPEGNKNLFGGLDTKLGEILQKQSSLFLEFNKGKPIAFFDTMELAAEYVVDFMEYNKASLQDQRAAEAVTIPNSLSISDEVKNEPGFVFFNPESGLEMVYGYNELIPDPDNSLYSEEKSRGNAIELLISQEISRECSQYLAGRIGFGALAFPGEHEDDILEENLNFLLRYWKAERYFSVPSITLA